MNHEMIEKIVNAIKQNCVSDFENYLQIHEVKLRQALATLPEPGINLTEWISVEDRLPMAHNEWILGYENGYKKAIPCSFNTKTKKFIDSDGFEITVNYWQPLPAPPLSHLEAKEGRG